jgi:thiamine biosynthesis lipoprotein
MACEFEVCLPAAIADDASGAAMEALDLVNRLEGELSYFREQSIVSEINRRASKEAVEVEPEMFSLLCLALEVSRDTLGAYDISASPLWEAWGFARREGAIPDEANMAAALARVGSQFIELDAARHTIRFLKPGMSINLGSIGKGYAVDRCGRHLLDAGVSHFLVHGGYSSVFAAGNRFGLSNPDDSTSGWSVGLRHPLTNEEGFDEVVLHDRALGTTGSQFQSFRHLGHRYGHVIDPRTGWPAEGVLSATVLAPTAALADALSTAFFVLGPEAAEAYCSAHAGIAGILSCPAAGGSCEVHRMGRAAPDVTVPPAQGPGP